MEYLKIAAIALVVILIAKFLFHLNGKKLLSLIVNRKLVTFLYLFVALDLFAMAYNNEQLYHRKNVTKAYIVAGIILLLYSILSFIGVL